MTALTTRERSVKNEWASKATGDRPRPSQVPLSEHVPNRGRPNVWSCVAKATRPFPIFFIKNKTYNCIKTHLSCARETIKCNTFVMVYKFLKLALLLSAATASVERAFQL